MALRFTATLTALLQLHMICSLLKPCLCGCLIVTEACTFTELSKIQGLPDESLSAEQNLQDLFGRFGRAVQGSHFGAFNNDVPRSAGVMLSWCS